MVLADRDHQGNVGVERASDQMGQALAIALALAEAIDDDEIGTMREGVRDPHPRILQPREIETAAARGRIEILREQKRLAAVKQHRRQARIRALAGLNHADDATATRIQIRREAAQDRVGVLMRLVDEGGEVALRIEHGPPPFDGRGLGPRRFRRGPGFPIRPPAGR